MKYLFNSSFSPMKIKATVIKIPNPTYTTYIIILKFKNKPKQLTNAVGFK
jgi:hypothetical protein